MPADTGSKEIAFARGQRLLQSLKRHHRTQADFARLAGVSQGYISSICAGDRPMSPKVVDAAVSLLGIDQQWLLEGDGEVAVNDKPQNAIVLLQQVEGLIRECQGALKKYHTGHLHDLLAAVIAHKPTSKAMLEAMLESILHLPPDEE